MEARSYPELAGQVAIVTGASQGIGQAIASELVRQQMKVVLAARNLQKLEELASSLGENAMALGCDVSDYAQVASLVEQAVSRWGQVDVLVNNAGIIDPISHLSESDPAAWSRAIDINVKGVYHGIRAVCPLMTEQGSGTIINISSGAANQPLEAWSHYCSSKAAVKMITACADHEMRGQGVRVIGLSPGTVQTNMIQKVHDSGVNPVSQMDPSNHVPPDWPARAVAYLCTKASDAHRGIDFSIKTDEGRREAGLIL